MYNSLSGVLALLSLVIGAMELLEPSREGEISDKMRGASQIIHGPNPGIVVHSPANLGDREGGFVLSFKNWDYQPSRATNPVAAFANGFQERNTGHVHGWIFNEAGEQVRFYGAAGAEFDGTFFVRPDEFAPGEYTAYFLLQNHDHTPAIQANASAFPAIRAVTFSVSN